MLTEICAEIKNYFSSCSDKYYGKFKVENGTLAPPLLMQNGQYYRIIGSVFNDGVHKQGDELIDESGFSGSVWLMRVPKDLEDLADQITEWCTKNEAIDSPAMSPFNSESFGGYSYSKDGGNSATNAGTWQGVFASKLNKYRKIRSV